MVDVVAAPTFTWKSPKGSVGYAENQLVNAILRGDSTLAKVWLDRGAQLVHYNAPYSLLWMAAERG